MYRIVPVMGHIQLEKAIEKSKENFKIKYVVFLNCGSRVDLTSKWFYLQKERKVKIVLMDSHRPIHHRNMNADKKIIILGITFIL